jgi:hypothetical protein
MMWNTQKSGPMTFGNDAQNHHPCQADTIGMHLKQASILTVQARSYKIISLAGCAEPRARVRIAGQLSTDAPRDCTGLLLQLKASKAGFGGFGAAGERGGLKCS